MNFLAAVMIQNLNASTNVFRIIDNKRAIIVNFAFVHTSVII